MKSEYLLLKNYYQELEKSNNENKRMNYALEEQIKKL